MYRLYCVTAFASLKISGRGRFPRRLRFPEECRKTDHQHIFRASGELKDFTIAPALKPNDVLYPVMEGKWIYHYNHCAYAYVTGSGSLGNHWPTDHHELEVVPQYFIVGASML